MIKFAVSGTPRPKQSFRYTANGGGYTPHAVKEWQTEVSIMARGAMGGRQALTGDLLVAIDFYLPDRRRRDLDNLSKAVLDGMNRIVFEDDQQIVQLRLAKTISKEPGIVVSVLE